MSTFLILRKSALRLAESNESLKAQIGHPYSLGPWYNARIGFSPSRSMCTCVFQLQGANQITDINVRAVRPSIVASDEKGDQGKPAIGLVDKIFANTFIYNSLGSGEWRIVSCDAMFPAGGGLVRPQSLLEDQPTAQDNKNDKQ